MVGSFVAGFKSPEGQYGTVWVRDWFFMHDGDSYMGIEGQVRVIEDSEAFGFRTRGGQGDNWVVVIKGDTEEVVIQGCAIKGATAHIKPPTVEVNNSRPKQVYKVP